MAFSRIGNLVLVLEFCLENVSPRLRKCRHPTLYILLEVLGHKPKKAMQSAHAHGELIALPLQRRGRRRRGEFDALHSTPFPLSCLVPLTLFDNMLRARRLSVFLA
jgi:hypothetical protein